LRNLKKAKAHQKLRSTKSSITHSRKVPSNLLLPSRRRKAKLPSQLEILRAKKERGMLSPKRTSSSISSLSSNSTT